MNAIKTIGKQGIRLAEVLGLLLVGIATLIAIGQEVHAMVLAAKVTLADLLLMFIYLEVLAMVGLYLESGRLPVRIPLYIAIVALARYMILDMKAMDTYRLFGVALAILILALTVLVIRYGHKKYAYDKCE